VDVEVDLCRLAGLCPGGRYGNGVGNRPEGVTASADLAFDIIEGVWAKVEVSGEVEELTGAGSYAVVKRLSSSTPGPAECFRLLVRRFWKRMNAIRTARTRAPPTPAPMAMYLTEDDFAFTGVGVDVAMGVYTNRSISHTFGNEGSTTVTLIVCC